MARRGRHNPRPMAHEPPLKLTTLCRGELGEKPDQARDEMFIDCNPYLSMRGFGIGHSREQVQKRSEKWMMGPADPGNAARARSRGVNRYQTAATDSEAAPPRFENVTGRTRRSK